MKLFVSSDPHGFYSLWRAALDGAGFDPENPGHIPLLLGDLFDRGSENLAMLEAAETLPRLRLVRGNHEDNLAALLRRGALLKEDYANGTDVTIAEFFGDAGFSDQSPMKTRLLRLLSSMPDYLETEHYVFVHGWLPLRFREDGPYIPEDWRCASEEEWNTAHTLEWQQTYPAGLTLPDKTIVCGHRPASLCHYLVPGRYHDDHFPFSAPGILALDGDTAKSGVVNVAVLEEDRFFTNGI